MHVYNGWAEAIFLFGFLMNGRPEKNLRRTTPRHD